MHCNNCGNDAPGKPGTCPNCGLKFSDTAALAGKDPRPQAGQALQPGEARPPAELSSHEAPPYPYIISTRRLLLLYFATLGLYQFIWFYRHWRSLKALSGENIWPAARSFLGAVYIGPLLKRFSELASPFDKDKALNSNSLAALFVLSLFAWKLPSPFDFLGFIAVIPLAKGQRLINFYWGKRGAGARPYPMGTGTWAAVLLGGVTWILVLLGSLGELRLNYLPWPTLNDPGGSYSLRLPAKPQTEAGERGLTARARVADCNFVFKEEVTGLDFSKTGDQELKDLIRYTLQEDFPEISSMEVMKAGGAAIIDSGAKDEEGNPFYLRFVFKGSRAFRLATNCSSLTDEKDLLRHHARFTGSFKLK